MECHSLSTWLAALEERQPEHCMVFGEKALDNFRSVVKDIIGSDVIAKKVITVAGTNGKGSTVAFLENILKNTGLRYGATYSPHLMSYGERIRINGQNAADEEICEAFNQIEKVRSGRHVSFFEFTALAAFYLFAKSNLDIAILEIGMGGRLDAMNVMDPDIAVITTIGLDHQEYLGDTIEKIAYEKAGIIRANKPVIYGDYLVPKSIVFRANALNAIKFFRGEQFHIKGDERCWEFTGKQQDLKSVHLEMQKTQLPLTSAACAVQTALLLKCDQISHSDIIQGIESTELAGRNQIFSVSISPKKKITVRCDVAHNAQAVHYLTKLLGMHPCKGRRVALVCMLQGKDVKSALSQAIHGIFDCWYISTVSYKQRALPGSCVTAVLNALEEKNVFCFATIPETLDILFGVLNDDDELVVFGSFYTVSEVCTFLRTRVEIA